MDRTMRPPWRVVMILILTVLVILAGNHEFAAAGQIPANPKINKLPAELVSTLKREMLEADAKDDITFNIGSMLDNLALLAALEDESGRRIFDAELTFMRWLGEQRCVDRYSDHPHPSALKCAHECDALFFGWSDEHVSILKLVAGSSLLSSEYPFTVSVGPDGWSLCHDCADGGPFERCVVHSKRKLALMPWIRRRVGIFNLMGPDPAKERGSPMRLWRLQLDVRGWPANAPRRPIGERLSDEQLARMFAALLESPTVRELSLKWAPEASYPAVLGAIDQTLASKSSRVTHLQIVETSDGSMESEERELLPVLVKQSSLKNWKRIRGVAVKWTSPNRPSDPMPRLKVFKTFTERLPNLRSEHVEPDYLPLDEGSREFLWNWIRSSELLGTTRSLYWKGLFFGIAPNANAVSAAANGPSYALRLMLPWLDGNGNSRYDLEPLGAEALRQTATLTLYAGKAVPTPRRTEDLAIGQAEGLARLVVESGQGGVFCNKIVRRLPAELPASTRHLVLRTFKLPDGDHNDRALRRLEAILMGNPSLSSVTVGLHLPCDDSVPTLKPLIRIAKVLKARTKTTAVRIELSTCKARTRRLDLYLKRLRAFVPFAAVRLRAPKVDDIVARLHSGSLIYQ